MNEVPKLEMLGLLDIKGQDCIRRVYDPNGLSPTLTTCGGGVQTSEDFRQKALSS